MFVSVPICRRLAGLVLLAAATVPRLVGQSQPSPATSGSNGLSASIGAQTEYNSNINENNASPLAGWEQEVFADLGLRRESAARSLMIAYRPYLQLYTADPALNTFNQIGTVRASVDLGPQWTITGSGSGGYLEELPANTITGLQPLLSASTYSAVPRAREESGQAQLALGYQVSPRLSLQATGAYSALRFPNVPAGEGVLNRLGGSEAGLSVLFAASSRTSIGARYGLQNFSVGEASHLAADSVELTWAHALTALTRVQAYAGAEYSQVHDRWTLDVAGAAITAHIYRVRTYPTFGGVAAHTGAEWNWSLRGDRRISNGGGALPFPVSLWDLRATLSPRLSSRWQVRFGAHVSRMSALASGILASDLRMAAGGVEVTRAVGRHLSAGLEANYLAQTASGSLALAPRVNRFVGGVRLLWQWPAAPEGGR